MQTQNRGISGTQPSNNPFASASLYVGDLAPDVTEATLFELFNAVGPVASIRVCRDATTRRSLGYAYVNFHSVQDAERALDTMNFTNIRGKQCRIMWSQRDPRLRQSGKGNIFVKNLHESIDNKTLYDTFSVFGNILSCKVVIDKETQKSRGYGYVHYVDDKSAKKAIEGVNGMTISDRKVHAELFKPRSERLKSFKYTNVYVKYIPSSWNDKLIIQIFQETTGGTINKDSYTIMRKEYGVSACLNFTEPQHAKKAVDMLNGKGIRKENYIQAKKDKSDSKQAPKSQQELEQEAETVQNYFKKWEKFMDSPQQQKPKQDDNNKDNKDDDNQADKDKNDDGDDNKNEEKKDEKKDDDDENKDDSKQEQAVTTNISDSQFAAKGLYVARAMKRKERKETLAREQRKKGIGARRNYTGANLYVKNLSPDVNDEKLRGMFSNFGTITSAKVMLEASGKSRGFGFVAFDKKEAATRAIHEMTNTLHHGKPLYVSRAQNKAFRQQFIMKQLRNKRMRNNNRGGYNNQNNQNNQNMSGGGGYGGPQQQQQQQQHQQQQQQQQSGGYGGYGGPQQAFGQQQFGGPQQQQQGGYGGPNRGGMQQMGGMPPRGPFGNMPPMNMGGMPPMTGPGPMGPTYGNPHIAAQLQAQQIAAQQLAAQQRAAQLQAQSGVATNPALQAQLQQAAQLQAQQLQSMGQQAAATTSMQMSSIQQQAAHRSQSMGQPTQQSQPAQSMQSGPQSTSMYAGSASIPRPVASGLTASQNNLVTGVTGAIASQPHQSSVPTGQHSVSQLSAGGAGGTSAPMLEVNPLTSEMLADAKPAEKKRLIGERLFPKIQVVEPRLAGKITGMLLEMDNTELLVLLSEQRALMNKINEALAVLKDHQQKQSQQNPGSTKNPSSQNPGMGSAQN